MEQAWTDFCRRLERVGLSLFDDAYPSDPLDRAEGFRHVTRDLVYALQWYVEYRDPAFPQFHRYMDYTTNWGGPCVDFVYLRARVSAEHSYVVSGNVAGCNQVSFSLAEGEMHLEQYGVYGQLGLHELAVGADGALEILLAPERPAGHRGNFLALTPSTDHLVVRVITSDWLRDALPTLRIHRIGSEGEAPPRLTAERLEHQLDEAMRWVEASLPYWNAYTKPGRGNAKINEVRTPSGTPGGAPQFKYAGMYWSLPEPDDALVVEYDAAPDSPYWSIHYYTVGWFESPDFANRQVSYTGATLHVDGDGKVRVVISHRDPGVPNWIDTEGRPTGYVAMRWTFVDRAVAKPLTTKVKFADLRASLPADHPDVDDGFRRRQLIERREGFLRRFRGG